MSVVFAPVLALDITHLMQLTHVRLAPTQNPLIVIIQDLVGEQIIAPTHVMVLIIQRAIVLRILAAISLQILLIQQGALGRVTVVISGMVQVVLHVPDFW